MATEEIWSPGHISLLFVASYMIITILIGYWMSRRGKTYQDVMIAGKSMPLWMIFMTFTAATMGTATFVGYVGYGWRYGVSYAWIAITASSMLEAFLFVPYLARMTRVTVAEPIGERYDSKTRLVCSILAFSRTLGSCAVQVTGMGMVLSVMTGMPVSYGIISGFLVALLYTLLGTQYASTRNELIQGAISWTCLIVGPFVAISIAGHGGLSQGWTNIMSLPPRYFDWMTIGQWTIVGWLFTFTFGQFLQPHVYARIYGAKTARDGAIGAYLGGAAILFGQCISCVVMGLAAAVVIPTLPTSDMASSTLFLMGPVIFGAIFCTAVFSAGMSVMSAQLMAACGIIITDWYFGITKRDMSAKQAKWASRVIMVLFGTAGVTWGVGWQDVIAIFTFSYDVLVGALIVPFFAAFFWPRMTTRGATAAAAGGGITAIVWQFIVIPSKFFAPPIGALPDIVPALSVSLLCAIFFSYTMKPEYEKTVKFAEIYHLDSLRKRAEVALKVFMKGVTVGEPPPGIPTERRE